MTLGFAVLGTPSLTVDGQLVVLPAGRPQAVLVALLLGEGRRVSIERIVETLWDEPPASAVPNIRGYVARLRRLLGRHSGRLGRSTEGYALTVHSGEVDLMTWQQHLSAADRAGRQGRPAEAADRLAAALGLWTGPAADGVPRRGGVGRALDAWDETRRTATERYAIACLDAGLPATAVDVLRPFVAEHPARELAWQHYIRALAEAGDRPGALTAYAAARRALVEHLGIEPGTGLRELQRDLLRPVGTTAVPSPPSPPSPSSSAEAGRTGDRSDSRSAEALARAAADRGQDSARTADLPPCPELVGRDELVADLSEALSRACPRTVLALHGPAGVGKSVLAARAAWQVAGQYDRHLHLDLLGATPGMSPPNAADTIGTLLRLLDVRTSAASQVETVGALRAALSERRTLIILDNVVDAAQVRPTLSALGTAVAVLTSRTVLSALDVTRHVPVGELSPAASVALLARHGGTDRVAADPGRARQVAAMCGHLPLALRIVAGRLASHPEWTLAAMAGRLREEKHRLDELTHDDLAVRAGLAVTRATLAQHGAGRDALRLFTAWGGAGLPIVGGDVAAVLLGDGDRRAYAALDRLSEARLAEPTGDGRYRMHDLVRLYAMELSREAPAEEERRACGDRIRRYYLAAARQARDLVRPEPHRMADEPTEALSLPGLADAPAALAWLAAERVNLMALARSAAADPSKAGDLFVARLVVELYPFLPMSGYYQDWLELAGLAVDCATRAGSRPDEAAARIHLAGAQSRQGNHRQAVELLRTALELAESAELPGLVTLALDHLAITITSAGDPRGATPYFERCVALHRAAGDNRRLGVTLNNFADALLHLGDTAAALRHLHESLALREAIGDSLGIGITILTIGQAYAQDGRLEQAGRWLDRALVAARDSGNREAEWRALTVRAEVHLAAGLPGRARTDLIGALAMSEKIGHTAGAAQVRARLEALA